MKVWWTNNNPKLICSYYLESVESSGGCMFLFFILDLLEFEFSLVQLYHLWHKVIQGLKTMELQMPTLYFIIGMIPVYLEWSNIDGCSRRRMLCLRLHGLNCINILLLVLRTSSRREDICSSSHSPNGEFRRCDTPYLGSQNFNYPNCQSKSTLPCKERYIH